MSIAECTHCGTANPTHAKFCMSCGTALATAPRTPAAPAAAAASAQPTSWVRHIDPWEGFALEHPAGWQVRCRNGEINVQQDSRGQVGAAICRMQVPAGTSLQAAAELIANAMRQANPPIDVSLMPELEAGRVLFRGHWEEHGAHTETRGDISQMGPFIVIRGIQSPAPDSLDAPSPRAAELARIIDSFEIVPAIPRRKFVEPTIGAFAVLVPVGWKTSADVNRTFWRDIITCRFAAFQDKRKTIGVAVPGKVWRHLDGEAGGWLASPFMSARKYAETILPLKLMWGLMPFEGAGEEFSDLQPQLCSDAARLGIGAQDLEISTDRSATTLEKKRTRLRHHLFTATARPKGAAAKSSDLAGRWIAEFVGYYHAPEQEFAAMQPVLAGILRSFQVDPNLRKRMDERAAKEEQEFWRMQAQQMQQMQIQQAQFQQMHFQQMMYSNNMVQQNAMHTIQHNYENQQAMGDMIVQTGQYHNASMDHIFHQQSNATLGLTDVVNPSTGQVYAVQNDYDRYWQANDGTILGGSFGVQPDPSWQKLKPFKI